MPDFWVEDAAQDIALNVWRHGRDTPGYVRLAAIDAARRYGPVSRRGLRRSPAPLAIHPAAAPTAEAGDMLDLRRGLGSLTRCQRRGLFRALHGLPMTNADSAAASAARRRLRALLAA